MHSRKYIIDKLVTKSCLIFGNPSKLTSQKVAQYLLGTRDTTEVFKLYELRYLLLKIYPLIHNLFHNPRVNPKLTSYKIKNLNHKPRDESLSLIKDQKFPAKFTLPFRTHSFFMVKRKNTPPQILFASITPNFSDIIYNAAQICNMPWHKNRWLSGSITAAISYPSDKLVWKYLQDETQEKVFKNAFKKWGKNNENKEKIKEKIKYYGGSRWPSLLVIPDVANNIMILKEARKVGLPVIGLVNSNCLLEIDYPIFAQDETLQSIHFFCHFLAVLIAKESVFLQHKRYTLQKIARKTFTIPETLQEKTKSELEEQFTLKKGIAFRKIRNGWKKPFFFEVVRPWEKIFKKRHFLTLHPKKYHPIILKKKRIKKRIQEQKKKQEFFYRFYQSKQRYKRYKQKLKKQKFQKQKQKRVGRTLKLSRPIYKKFFSSKNALRSIKIKHVHSVSRIFSKKINRKNAMKKRAKRFKFFPEQKNFGVRKKKLFKLEYKKKYFQKNKYTKNEKTNIQRTLRNFLWVSKIAQSMRKYGSRIHRRFSYPSTPHYFRHSLQQWSQHLKWRYHRRRLKKFLRIKKGRTKTWTDKPHRFKRKSRHYKSYKSKQRYKKYKQSKKKRIDPWKLWLKQNASPKSEKIKDNH